RTRGRPLPRGRTSCVTPESQLTQSLRNPGLDIEYRVDGQADIVRLITSLTDPEKYPAAELAALYARRWEIEMCQPQCTHKWELAV
ncbi:hypothetical protein AB0D77_48680, partial [Streptomyces sp. NPDC048385]